MLNKIDHIGIAVKNADQALDLYQHILGMEVVHEEAVPDFHLRTVSLQIGESLIELLQPLDEASTVHKFIQKRGEGIHHIAFRVENIEKKLAELKNAGIKLIDKEPRIGAGNKKVAFLHPKSTNGVLIELTEIQ